MCLNCRDGDRLGSKIPLRQGSATSSKYVAKEKGQKGPENVVTGAFTAESSGFAITILDIIRLVVMMISFIFDP